RHPRDVNGPQLKTSSSWDSPFGGTLPALRRECEPTSSVAGAAAARAFAFLRFVDLEGATVEVLAVQRLHGTGGIRGGHLNEAEATRTAGVAVVDQRKLLDGAVGRKQVAYCVFGRREGKVADVEFCHERVSQIEGKEMNERAARSTASRRVREGFWNG